MTVNLSALAGAGQQFFDNVGNTLSGGKLWSYQAGTTTPQATYTTSAGNVAHTNPIILDSAGRVPGGEIWLTTGASYKFVLMTSADVTLATWDNITGINGTGIATNASVVQYDPAGTGAVSTTVQAKLRQTVSVMDFGATSGGSNTAAINAAITYAISSGARVKFPFAATIRVPEDAPTIQAAIDAIYPDPTVGFLLTVQLSAGYLIANGTAVRNGDYSNIQITSIDSTVNVAPTFVGISGPGTDGFSTNCLLFVDKATAPRWSIFVNCNNIAGGLVYEQSKGFIAGSRGVTDSAEFGVYVKNQSQVFATNAIFTLSSYGNRVTVNSMFSAPQANFSGTKQQDYVGTNRAANLDVSRGSLVYVTGSSAAPTNLSGGLGHGLAVRRSFVSATDVDCSNVGQSGLATSLGSLVAFDGSIANNCGFAGIFCDAATVSFNNGTATGNGTFNIQSQAGGTVRARSAVLTGGVLGGVRAARGGQIYIPDANCRQDGVSDQITDIAVSEGSYISAVGALGGVNTFPLFPTMSGEIIKDTDVVAIAPRGAGDVNSIVDINVPDISTATATVRVFRGTNTSGTKQFIIYAGDGANTPRITANANGNLTITGVLSKGSGSFKIDHPLKPATHHLVHSFIEGPQADNIYRGTAALQSGKATINLDDAARMTHGTFAALNCNVQCYTTNESGWSAVRGKVEGNTLTIEAQDATCSDIVSWLVIGERCDQHIKDADWTDENGRVITEPVKESLNG
jgi:hypothetical protein